MYELTGRVFSHLKVLKRQGHNRFERAWLCQCDCGNQTVVPSNRLVTGKTRSCGCLVGMRCRENFTTHGMSDSYQFRILKSARIRAKRSGIQFSLKLSDIPDIPKSCPVLGISIFFTGIQHHGSASLDKIQNDEGYVNGNVRIISHRANQLKGNANSDELSAVLQDLINIEESEVDSFARS